MPIPEMRYCELKELEKSGEKGQKLLGHELKIDATYSLWLRIGRAGKHAAVVHPAVVLGKEPVRGDFQTIHLGLITPHAKVLAPLRPDMRQDELLNFGLVLPDHIVAPRRIPTGFLMELATDV